MNEQTRRKKRDIISDPYIETAKIYIQTRIITE